MCIFMVKISQYLFNDCCTTYLNVFYSSIVWGILKIFGCAISSKGQGNRNSIFTCDTFWISFYFARWSEILSSFRPGLLVLKFGLMLSSYAEDLQLPVFGSTVYIFPLIIIETVSSKESLLPVSMARGVNFLVCKNM